MLREMSKQCLRWISITNKKNAPNYHKNGETVKSRSHIPRLFGLPIYLILNILLNLLLLLEGFENPLADILPNLLFSFPFLCFLIIFHLKYQGTLAKKLLRRVVICFLLMETAFFTHTKLLIEITQRPEKIYFKTLVFLFESQTLVGILRPISRLYLAIAGLGYILLNIWIYRGYDLFTVLYGLLSYFTAILLILSGLIEPKKLKKLTNQHQQKGKSKAIVIKANNNNKKTAAKKTQDSNSLFDAAALQAKFPGKMTAEYSSMVDNSAMEVLEKIKESILVIETVENKVRLTNKGFDSLCQSKGVFEPLKLLENAIFQSKEGKEIGFIEILIEFKEKMLDPLYDAKKLKMKVLIEKFNQEDSLSEQLKMRLLPIKLNQEDCILISLSKTKQKQENSEINNQIKELQNNVNSLLKNLEILTLSIVKFIRVDSLELIDICHPLIESLRAPIRPLTPEIFKFKFQLFETHCMNCLDFTAFIRNNFILGFQNLSPKFFLGEIYQIFKPVVSAYGKNFEINLDEATPDFFQTDYKRLKQMLVILLNRALKTKGGSSKIIRLLAQSFQLDGHVIIRFTVEDPEISALELLKAQAFKDASQTEWKSLDLELVTVQLFASQLGIDPLKIGLKTSPGGIAFLVLDKSQQSKSELPKLPADLMVNKISQFAKSYSGTEPKNLEILKKSSLSCLEVHETFRNPSGKLVSENNYRFIDDLEPRNQESALILLVEPDLMQAYALESAFLSSGLQVLKAENNKKALELVQSKSDEIKLAIGRVKVVSRENVREMTRRGIKILGIGREEEKEEGSEKGFKEVIERPETITRVVRRWLS